MHKIQPFGNITSISQQNILVLIQIYGQLSMQNKEASYPCLSCHHKDGILRQCKTADAAQGGKEPFSVCPQPSLGSRGGHLGTS